MKMRKLFLLLMMSFMVAAPAFAGSSGLGQKEMNELSTMRAVNCHRVEKPRDSEGSRPQQSPQKDSSSAASDARG